MWVLGLVLPPVLSALGSLEEYSSRVTMLHFILRSAAVKLISIGTLVVYQLPFVVTTSCWETKLGQKLYAQVNDVTGDTSVINCKTVRFQV